jgi:hypothetical protein
VEELKSPHRPARSGDLRSSREGFVMLDIVVLAIGFAFFGLCLAYTAACDRL